MELLERDTQSRTLGKLDRLLELKYRVVWLGHLRMDSPRGLRVAIDSPLDTPAGLIEIRTAADDRNRLAGRCVGMEDRYGNLGQVQVPVLATPRPLHR